MPILTFTFSKDQVPFYRFTPHVFDQRVFNRWRKTSSNNATVRFATVSHKAIFRSKIK